MGEPAYQRIAAAVSARIFGGELRPGDPAPSTRALMRQHGVASATAARALALLRERGLIITVDRSGSVVSDAAVRAARPPARSRRRPDTRTEPAGSPSTPVVVRTAVAIADVDGLAAVTLRRVAVELGVPTLTVARAVTGHDELVRAMIQDVMQESPIPPADGTWRERLTAAAWRQWRMYRRHPWLPHVIALNRPQPVAALLALGEFELAALQEIEPDPVARMDLHLVFTALVRGLAADLAAEEQALADTGMDSEAWTSVDERLARTLRDHAGPALRAIDGYPYDIDRVFARGLRRLLDGFESAAGRAPS